MLVVDGGALRAVHALHFIHQVLLDLAQTPDAQHILRIHLTGGEKAAGFWALIAFALNTAAYTSEIVRGAVATTPPGEIEAGRAFGMGRGQILRRIILPSALRRALTRIDVI